MLVCLSDCAVAVLVCDSFALRSSHRHLNMSTELASSALSLLIGLDWNASPRVVVSGGGGCIEYWPGSKFIIGITILSLYRSHYNTATIAAVFAGVKQKRPTKSCCNFCTNYIRLVNMYRKFAL